MPYARSVRTRLAPLAAFALAGCTPHVRSQLVVVVDTDLVADTDYDHVRVRVTGPDGGVASDTTTALTSMAGTAGITLPFSFGIYPAGGDATRPVTVFVEALLGRTSVVSYQAATSYETGHVLELDLFLERVCVGRRPCPPDSNGNAQECGRRGQCVPIAVASTTLMDYNADAGFDATIAPPRDGVGEGGMEAAVDDGTAVPDVCTALDPLDDFGVDSNCDGADGSVTDTIFVAQGAPTSNSGLTPGAPVPTLALAAGVQHANPTRHTVLVAGATMDYAALGLESLLAAGCRVVGAYATPAWNRPTGAAAAPTPVVVNRDGVYVDGRSGAGIAFLDLRVDGTQSALSVHSVALVLNNAGGFTIDACTLRAGAALAGAAGGNGAASTLNGNAGRSASPSSTPATSCGGLNVVGAGGAAPSCPAGAGFGGGAGGCNTSGASHSGVSGSGPWSGAAGAEGNGPNLPSCTRTGPYAGCGVDGGPGSDGVVATASGANPAFVPIGGSSYSINLPSGGAGGMGGAGSGGGGGGGWTDSAGAFICGGGGSAGGCGGFGGFGGGMGGVSAAIVVTGVTTPTITRSHLLYGAGGVGGVGGAGGAGAPGGAPGLGMTCQGLDCSCTESGARGGVGGNGGHGGGGAGGNGGPSAGILGFGVSVAVPSGVTFTGPSTPSAGGTGGMPGGASGTAGVIAQTLAY